MLSWSLPAELEPILLIAGSLMAGLLAAYGRLLRAGKRPMPRWWPAHLLLLPMLIIGSIAARDLLSLSPSLTALTAGMLSLGGYDLLRVMEAQWRRRMLGDAGQGPLRAPSAPDDTKS